jgi:hypothetical protein
MADERSELSKGCAELTAKFPAMLPLHCSRCGQEVEPNRAVWLDLNLDTHELRAEPWPDDVSQGAFPFGPDCAKRAKVWGVGGRWTNER